MVYMFRNRFCPVCGRPVSPYSYVFNSDGLKIHLECESKHCGDNQEDG